MRVWQSGLLRLPSKQFFVDSNSTTRSRFDRGKTMKLWVDDERVAPEGWHWAKTYEEAMRCIALYAVEAISLDHDLGDVRSLTGREMTGYDVLLALTQNRIDGLQVPSDIRVHTANVPAGDRMRGVIERYWK